MNQNLNKSSNTQQAFWIALGSLFSFGFGIVSSMILSRFFSKDDYGTYKQVIYVYTTLLVVFNLGLPRAYSYFLPREDSKRAKDLIKKITSLFFVLGAVFSVLLFLFSDHIAEIMNNPKLGYAIKLFSPVPFLMLPTMGLEGILSTYRMTRFMAVYTFATRAVMLLCVALPVVIFHGDYIQAIIGFVIGSLIAFILALYFKYFPVSKESTDKTIITYKEIFKFTIPVMTASIWGVILTSTDQFFISRYFGTDAFAEFSNGFMQLPFMGMIVGASTTVLSPIFSKKSSQNADFSREVYPLWMSVFRKSAMLVYPLLLYTMVFADTIMVFLYGKQYHGSSIFFQIRNIASFFEVIVYGPLLINIGKVRFYQNVHMYSVLMLIPAEYLCVNFFSSPIIIAVVSIFFKVLRSIVMLVYVSKFFNVSFYKLFPVGLILKIAIPSLVILIPLHYILVGYYQTNNILTLFISFPIYVMLFLLYSIIVKIKYLELVRPILLKFHRKN